MNNFIKKHGLIVILRDIDIKIIPETVTALYNGGARIVEVAFNPSDPDTIPKTTAIIKKIYETMGNKMVVGAGTVIKKDYLTAAYFAGAKFIFSPNVNEKLIKDTKRLGLVSIPGAFTPTEMVNAFNAGADIIKLFPITKDDIGYLKNVTRPLSHIPFITVGGVDADTIPLFIDAGACGVGTGISILKNELLKSRRFDEITALTKAHLDAISKARGDKK